MQTTTSLTRPLALNDHFKSPQGYSLYILPLVLSVKLTFVPRQHVLKSNKHGNVNKCPPINIYFLIAGLENKYFLGKSERP